MIKQILSLEIEDITKDVSCKDDYYFEAIVEEYFTTGLKKEREVI